MKTKNINKYVQIYPEPGKLFLIFRTEIYLFLRAAEYWAHY